MTFNVSFKNDKQEISISNHSVPSGTELENIYDFIKRISELDEPVVKIAMPKGEKSPVNIVKTQPKNDLGIVRDRLPNRDKGGNIIDMNELKISEPIAGKAYKNFRCPECGQSALIIADLDNDVTYVVNNVIDTAIASGTVIVRDIVHNDKLFSVNMNTDIITAYTYESACRNVIEEVVLVAGENNKACVCTKCGNQDAVDVFIDAYQNPLKYFDTEEICPLCGDEMCVAVINEAQQTLKCENKDCYFEKVVE